jgi:hypothetical protein
MTSKNRNQLELLASVAEPHVEPITPELIQSIKRRPTFLHAWNFAVDFSAMEEKQVYGPLDIDASHWTKIRSGRAYIPADHRFNHFLDVVRNEIPLVWWAESRGYDWTTIRKHRSSEQREIADLKDENRDLRRALSLVLESKGLK